MSTVSANRTVPALGAETAPRKAFGVANFFAGIGRLKPKKRSRELEYTTREELQDLFNDDLRKSDVSKPD